LGVLARWDPSRNRMKKKTAMIARIEAPYCFSPPVQKKKNRCEGLQGRPANVTKRRDASVLRAVAKLSRVSVKGENLTQKKNQQKNRKKNGEPAKKTGGFREAKN